MMRRLAVGPAASTRLAGLVGWSRKGFSTAEGRQLWRWGATEGGYMGSLEAAEVSKEPSLVDDFRGASTAACGSNHSAFVVDGRLYTYGSTKYSQLGHSSASSGSMTEPGLVELEGRRVSQVALGAFHSACVADDGSLWTWGWGGGFFHGVGALGHGNSDSMPLPAMVENLEQVKLVACGAQHTLALTTDGLLFATGKGDFGRLGRGDTSDENDFQEIDYFQQTDDSILRPGQPAKISKIGAGANFSAAMSEQGELWVWGRNDYGQLGLGEEAMGDMYSAERFPRLVRSLPAEGHQVVDFACGEHHVVALTSEGAIFEWGNRTWLEPHRVSKPKLGTDDFADIVKVEAGDKFSMALTRSGKVFVW
eukprot:CAMPEP_0197634696 /NCGR_PEP_ID=MMETSP1338-20131121/10716_1 /TAXON_ID=43686 ORGANISM="Pelagodinium beii, Strain RCC1491" /NCGR_SAMPLE_ID=MMETSP1338 /ASSEMBLY_ACC=CAM_ASM_000754 /LENGTH=364 /DNA_ID=CAMNT_0043206603 /DNA_START=62 /DNA_END=1153 /DNA_ORIENTATION=+